ncbi:MAG: phosphotransferase [Pseudomonadota bacterium]
MDDHITEFLKNAGWGHASARPLAGDASNRRYHRLTHPDGRKAVLMDAPPHRGEDVRPFLSIAKHLRDTDLSAPEVFAADETEGLLVLEDLGDALYARVLESEPNRELAFYTAAIDALHHLHRLPPPDGLEAYDSSTMPDLGALAFEWYGNETQHQDTAGPLRGALKRALEPFDGPPRVLVQRDYHAENLLWLGDREGVARVGLLDFQDARVGHPAYDIVSLLEDARRDVDPRTVKACLAHYIDISGSDPEEFQAAYATMGAQRNLRILGVFARLSLHFGKPHYVDLIPRVWAHLQTDLKHQHLANVADIALNGLPEPTPAHLQDLKDRCGTIPML